MSFATRRVLAASPMALAIVLGLVVGSTGIVGPAFAASPPAQPAKGPGSTEYVTSDVLKQAFGTGAAQGLVFRPAGTSAKPRPVIIFLHAPGAYSPRHYGAWIEHLARRGNIVIYPRYQEDVGKTVPTRMAEEAIKGIKAALAGLKADPEANADLSRIAALGHSGGAILAADIARRGPEQDLPPIRLVFGVTPAMPASEKVKGVPLADLDKLDPKTVLVMMTGDKDNVAGERGGRRILSEAEGLAPDHKLLIRTGSDTHGQPPLFFGHYSAVAPNGAYDLSAIPGANDAPPAEAAGDKPKPTPAEARAAREAARKQAAELWRAGYEERKELPSYESQAVDATDYLVFWKTFDLAADTVLAGGDANVLKRDPRLYDVGKWSDGWPLRRLTTETPKPRAPKAEAVNAEPTAPKRN